MAELGPFSPAPGRRGLQRNRHAWNKFANIVFVDSPAFAGFSYSNDTADLDVGELRAALLPGWNHALRPGPNSTSTGLHQGSLSMAGCNVSLYTSQGLCCAGHERTIRDLVVFLDRWLQRFPAFHSRAFFVTGESFAGEDAPRFVVRK